MDAPFADRHVVVTGAAGQLGGAVARLLLQQGGILHLPVRSPLDTARFGAGDRVRAVSGVDLTDEAALRSLYESLPALWASIHCAGAFALSPIVETSLADLDRMLAANLRSAFLCCREAARRLRAMPGAPGGRMVNVAARGALEPRTAAGMVAYVSSKAAVAALTEALAEELAPEGIWVNAVAPSILDTPENRRAMPQADAARWPRVDEVAATIAFLASPENRVARGAIVTAYGRA